MKPFLSPPAALFSLLALAACSADKPTSTALFCPKVAVLSEASTITQYLPGQSGIADEVTTGHITGVAGACKLNGDNKTLTVSFKAGFSASKGPANHGQPVTLPYFIAITQGETIIQKVDYTIRLSFDGNVSSTDATSQILSASFANDPSSQDDQILVSFQLTPEQLKANAGN